MADLSPELYTLTGSRVSLTTSENTLASSDETLTCNGETVASPEDTFTISEVGYLINGRWCVRQLDPITVTKKSFDSNEVVVFSGKRFRATPIRAILHQLQRWQELDNHDNLIRIRGIHTTLDIPRLILVSDYPYPTILDFLQDVEHLHSPEDNITDCTSCTQIADFRYTSCVQIADGLQFLHSKHIVHGAIRGSNVLVKPDGICCLGEFSEERGPSEATLNRYANWMAPELVDLHKFLKLHVPHYELQDNPPYLGTYRKVNSDSGLVQKVYTWLHRQPTEEEKDKIPEKMLSAINAYLLGYIPGVRSDAERAHKLLKYLEAYRIRTELDDFNARAEARKVFFKWLLGERCI
ncbi:hypothetical protein GALMADRAFT_1221021 [Galerina marginata CBS 339.88]|uniref:Protein kinase domain-containing protein n=1 Tax=Galerina marginata (strain CBS 339.88) TaxID=685588 RepID=A0A067S4H3_GALM3|nr:hypothetical protein GALMADRAFT_1221021 [Galerina marginata CBS 339.88]